MSAGKRSRGSHSYFSRSAPLLSVEFWPSLRPTPMTAQSSTPICRYPFFRRPSLALCTQTTSLCLTVALENRALSMDTAATSRLQVWRITTAPRVKCAAQQHHFPFRAVSAADGPEQHAKRRAIRVRISRRLVARQTIRHLKVLREVRIHSHQPRPEFGPFIGGA